MSKSTSIQGQDGEFQEMDERSFRIDPRLLEILVCPITKTGLTYDRAHQELISKAARLAFPIRDAIPILLVDEARPLED